MNGIRSSEKKGGEGVQGNIVVVSYLDVWITWLAQKMEWWVWGREVGKERRWSVITGTSRDTAEVNSIQMLMHLICQCQWQMGKGWSFGIQEVACYWHPNLEINPWTGANVFRILNMCKITGLLGVKPTLCTAMHHYMNCYEPMFLFQKACLWVSMWALTCSRANLSKSCHLLSCPTLTNSESNQVSRRKIVPRFQWGAQSQINIIC